MPSTARDSLSVNPKIYALKSCTIYKILWHPDSFVYLDSIIGLQADPAFGEGRRAGALFFARHRDCFIVTRNFTSIYLDLVPFRSFTLTRSSLPSTRTGKKLRTATLRYRSGQAPTAPNQTAGPLCLSASVRVRDRLAILRGKETLHPST